MKTIYEIEWCDNGLCIHVKPENNDPSSHVIEFGEDEGDYSNAVNKLGHEWFAELRAFLDENMTNNAIVTFSFQTKETDSSKPAPIPFGAPD